MESSESIGAIAARLSRAMGTVAAMEPQGWNDFHKYKFYSIDQIMAEARRVLSAAGVSILPTPLEVLEASEGKTQRVVVRLAVTFMCEEGEWVRSAWTGEGLDTSDKAYNKAYTAAFKQCLQKTLMLGGDGDADAESPERPSSSYVKPTSTALEDRETILDKLRGLVSEDEVDALDAAIAATVRVENISMVGTEWLRTFKGRLGKYGTMEERSAMVRQFIAQKLPAGAGAIPDADDDVDMFAAEQRRLAASGEVE